MDGQILEFVYTKVGEAGGARITGQYQVVPAATTKYSAVVVGRIVSTPKGYVVVSENGRSPLGDYLSYQPKYLN